MGDEQATDTRGRAAVALARARSGDEEAFALLTDPLRRELQLHCYRILGSVQDAEEVLQESFLAAWRGLGDFEGRASLRSWIYRIATNRCLNALRDRRQRSPEQERASQPDPPFPRPTRHSEPLWLQPLPEALLDGIPDSAPGPQARYEARESIELAFMTALQHLPARQRAALVLRDVLGFSAADAAAMLDVSIASLNSALQRARATLDARYVGRRGRSPAPRSASERELVGRFAEAFENDDIEGLVKLLSADAILTMPPEPLEYEGPAAIAELFRERSWWGRRLIRLVPIRANGQPAFGYYVRDRQAGCARVNGLIVLTLDGMRISAITRFGDNSVIPYFGLPRSIPA